MYEVSAPVDNHETHLAEALHGIVRRRARESGALTTGRPARPHRGTGVCLPALGDGIPQPRKQVLHHAVLAHETQREVAGIEHRYRFIDARPRTLHEPASHAGHLAEQTADGAAELPAFVLGLR